MSKLFEPWSWAGLTLENRIVIAPMCQYSAHDGNATDWHLMHWGAMSQSGAGLLILEATAVSPEGRISANDLGLYSDANERALARLLSMVHQYSNMPVAIQLAHAGRKASSRVPWEGGGQLKASAPQGWQTEAPSPVPHTVGDEEPVELTHDDLERIQTNFTKAAKRAVRIGLSGIEVHMAHGYLLHQFLSPLSNRRNDEYGGSLENRMRFPLQIFKAIRQAVPVGFPLWVRVSATDWVEGGWTLEECIVFCRALKNLGCDVIHVSSGGVSTEQKIPLSAGYQVPFAKQIRQACNMPVIAVGLITEPHQAEQILEQEEADAVALGRAMLYDPHWPWKAAAELGAKIHAPKQYWRSQPRGVGELFKSAP